MKIRGSISEDETYIMWLMEGRERRYLGGFGIAIELWEVHGEPRLIYMGPSCTGKHWMFAFLWFIIAIPMKARKFKV